jgi:hypothetical protein
MTIVNDRHGFLLFFREESVMRLVNWLLVLGTSILAGSAIAAPPASAANLIGTWYGPILCAEVSSELGSVPGDGYTFPGPAYVQIVITDQDGERFVGHSCEVTGPRSYFAGVLDGRDVYLTVWDDIISAKLKGYTLYYFSQIFSGESEGDDEQISASTCVGYVEKFTTKTEDGCALPPPSP